MGNNFFILKKTLFFCKIPILKKKTLCTHTHNYILLYQNVTLQPFQRSKKNAYLHSSILNIKCMRSILKKSTIISCLRRPSWILGDILKKIIKKIIHFLMFSYVIQEDLHIFDY